MRGPKKKDLKLRYMPRSDDVMDIVKTMKNQHSGNAAHPAKTRNNAA